MNIRTLSLIGILAVSVVCLPVASAAATQAKPKASLQKVTTILYPILVQSSAPVVYQIQSQSQPVYTPYYPQPYQPYNLPAGYRQTWNGSYPSSYYPYYPNNNYGSCSTYGIYSRYAGIQSGCTCSEGYQWNANGTECVPVSYRADIRSLDTGCYLMNGKRTSYDDPACYCGNGGMWNENRQCVPMRYDYCGVRVDAHSSYQYDYDSGDRGCYCDSGFRADNTRSYCVRDTTSGQSGPMRDRQLRY